MLKVIFLQSRHINLAQILRENSTCSFELLCFAILNLFYIEQAHLLLSSNLQTLKSKRERIQKQASNICDGFYIQEIKYSWHALSNFYIV